MSITNNPLIDTPRHELEEPWIKEKETGGFQYLCHFCRTWHDTIDTLITAMRYDGRRRAVCKTCRTEKKIMTVRAATLVHPWDNPPDLTDDPIDNMEPLAMGTGWLRPSNTNGGNHG